MWVLDRIPQIMHCYWGSHMLSWLRFLTIQSFSIQNPDWKIKFYYPKQIYTGGPVWNQGFAEQVTGENYFNKVKNIPNVQTVEIDFDKEGIGHIPDVFRSDILRLKLLAFEGGIWQDMDILNFKSIDEVHFNTKGNPVDTVISMHPSKHHYSIGFLMSKAGNPFFNFLYNKSMELKKQDGEYQHLGITMWHKSFPKVEHIKKKFPYLHIEDIEMWLCYYYNSFQVEKFLKEDLPFEDERTIAFHWYAGHPKCVEWEIKLTPNNYTQFNNTISSTIKKALKQ